MSFLKINDPLKRDAIVKEYLDLKNRIRSNLLSERIGESQLQTDLSKFYRPITETQKATTREITEGLKPISEGLKPISEGLENIRRDVQDIPGIVSDMEAVKKYGQEKQEKQEKQKEEEVMGLGEIAKEYLRRSYTDKTFGIRDENGLLYIGNKQVIIVNNNIIVDDRKFKGTRGLWELLMSKDPKTYYVDDDDYNEYSKLMVKTNALHKDYDPKNPYPRSNRGNKWNLIRDIWANREDIRKEEGYEGSGVVVIPSDPNALLERLDLLLASQEAGHTGVRNELVSICDELKRQGVLDTNSYKKLNHLIKK